MISCKNVYKQFPELKEIDDQILDVRNSRFIAVIDNDERLIKRFDIAEEDLECICSTCCIGNCD